jgi:uridine phosphorylase
VCSVFANRSTGEFRTEGESRAAEVGSLAAALLHEMADRQAEVGAGAWHADLSL